jgi:SHS2 domain-containing protein
MSKDDFEVVEGISSADYIFDAFGDSLEELFLNCARACFHAMTDIDTVDPAVDFDLAVKAENMDDLLYNFISELIFLKDTEVVFLSQFGINIEPGGKALKAVVYGESIDYNKHVIKTDVKAATYHDLHVRRERGRFSVRMTLDL